MSTASISMKELHSRLRNLGKTDIVLDVRGPDEYAEGHVPGSINIPHTDVAAHAPELKHYQRIYIHCRAGGRAQTAFQALQKQGLTNLVCISDGGMPDWISAGYETVRGT